MNALHSKNSILIKFAVCILLGMLVPSIVLIAFTKSHSSNIEQNNARQYLSTNLNTVSTSIDGIIDNVERFYVPLLMDKKFNHTVSSLSPYESRSEYQDYLDTHYIQDKLTESAASNNYIYSLYAYSYPANRFFSSKVNWNPDFNKYNKESSDWLINYEYNSPSSHWTLINGVEDGRPMLTSYRGIKQAENLYGIISINIDATVISKQLRSITPDSESYCFMTDSDFNVIGASNYEESDSYVYETVLKKMSSQENKEFFTATIEKQKMFVFSVISPNTNFRYFIVSPYKNINTISSMLTQLITGYFICILLLVILLIFLSIYIFFRPIKQLFVGMKVVQDGDFTIRLPESSSYEIGYINGQFNAMIENIQKLIRQNYEHQLLRKDAEIRNIQNQLNEHFLYNTLDTIRWTARAEDSPQTSKMVYSLATFYRINLSSGKDFITVAQIEQMLNSYLMIQEIRMRDQFSYVLTCAPETHNIRILKYLFQPIVENSLVHGLNGIPHKLEIAITFEITGDFFRFAVRDNGVGISDEKKDAIFNSIKRNEEGDIEHFALNMIHRQLLLEYDLPHGLFIHSELNHYCEIGFEIPLEKLERDLL